MRRLLLAWLLRPRRIVHATHATPNTRQVGFRFRTGDTVTLNNNTTWAAAQNTNWSQGLGVFRLRVEVEENGGGSISVAGRLEFSHNGGAYTPVTTTSSPIRAVASGQFNEGDATTNLLTAGAGTFVAGSGSEDGEGNAPSLTSQHTEWEFALQLLATGVAENDTFDFRIRPAGADLNSYVVTPRLTATGLPVSKSGSEAATAVETATVAVALTATETITGTEASTLDNGSLAIGVVDSLSTTDNLSTYTTPGGTIPANRKVYALIQLNENLSVVPDITDANVSGYGLTWARVEENLYDTTDVTHQLFAFEAETGASPVTGSFTTGSLPNGAATGIQIILVAIANYDTGEPHETTNVQIGSGNGTAASVAMNALGASENRYLALFGFNGNEAWTKGDAGATDVYNDVISSPNTRTVVLWGPAGDSSPSGTWGISSDWGGIALEIRQKVAAGEQKSGSEAATAVESAVLTVALTASETATATETAVQAVAIAATETAAAAESSILSQTSTEDSAAVETAVLSVALALSEVAAAAEAVDGIALTASEAVDAADDASLAVAVSASDTATAVESATNGVPKSGADAAVATEASVLVVATDASEVADTAEAAGVGLVASDTATAVETAQVAVPKAGSDEGAATEDAALTTALSPAEAATAVETAVLAAQAASNDENAAEDAAAQAVAIGATDEATTDESGTLAVPKAGSEVATATETAVLVVALTATDEAVAVDAGSLGTPKFASDTAVATEAADLAASVGASDTADATEDAQTSTGDASKSGSDTAAAVETAALTAALEVGEGAVSEEDAAATAALAASDATAATESGEPAAAIGATDEAGSDETAVRDIAGLSSDVAVAVETATVVAGISASDEAVAQETTVLTGTGIVPVTVLPAVSQAWVTVAAMTGGLEIPAISAPWSAVAALWVDDDDPSIPTVLEPVQAAARWG